MTATVKFLLTSQKYPRYLLKKSTSFRVEAQPFLDFSMQRRSGSEETYLNNLDCLNV